MSRRKTIEEEGAPVSERAWRYSGNRDGTKFAAPEGYKWGSKFSAKADRDVLDPHDVGYSVMPIKETKPHALSQPASYEPIPDTAWIRSVERQELTADEVAVLNLQAKFESFEEIRVTIASGSVVEYQRRGFTLIPGSAQLEQRAGLPDIETVQVYTRAFEQTESHSHQEIAEQLGLSVFQVRRLIQSANRKTRGMT